MVAGYASRAPAANVTLDPTTDSYVPTLHAPSLRDAFDAPRAPTIGIEEELMLLDPHTLDLAPRSEQALAALAGDARFKPELIAAQIETVTPPRRTVGDAAQVLRDARDELLDALADERVAEVERELALLRAALRPLKRRVDAMRDSLSSAGCR